MLFDLRGRGRRRTVQVIYLSLAVLMGGGLVLFGIGGGTNGGLFDAIGGSGSSSTSTDKVFQDRLAAYERQLKVNPQSTAALIGMTKLRFGNASTGDNFNQTQGAYTAKGLADLRQASAAWQRLSLLKAGQMLTRPAYVGCVQRAADELRQLGFFSDQIARLYIEQAKTVALRP